MAALPEAAGLLLANLPIGKGVTLNTGHGSEPHNATPPANLAAPGAVRSGRVFRRDDGEPYADAERQYGGQIKTGFSGALRRAGITEPTTPHDLRHTWATWFYALTRDPLLLKAEGGWASIAMVERYAHLMPSELAGEVAAVWGERHPRIARRVA